MANETLPPMDPVLREVFRLAYIYRQKYQHPTEPTEDLDFWKRAVEEANDLNNQLGQHPFARAILLACYIDIERELKDNRHKN